MSDPSDGGQIPRCGAIGMIDPPRLPMIVSTAKDILKMVTHGARGDVMDSYTTLPWAYVCAEVAKLRVQLVEGKVVALPTLAAVGGEPCVPAEE